MVGSQIRKAKCKVSRLQTQAEKGVTVAGLQMGTPMGGSGAGYNSRRGFAVKCVFMESKLSRLCEVWTGIEGTGTLPACAKGGCLCRLCHIFRTARCLCQCCSTGRRQAWGPIGGRFALF